MTLHALDANMKAANVFYGDRWQPDDFDACCKCGCDFADTDNDDHDPHAIQSKSDPMLCAFCFDTMGDEQ